jgi:hypothetical protein
MLTLLDAQALWKQISAAPAAAEGEQALLLSD